MTIQAFVPIIARQSTVAKDLRQTRRAKSTVVPPALPAFSDFSASIMERLLRREPGLWERFSLQYMDDEENGSTPGPVQIHNHNNVYLRFLLDHIKTQEKAGARPQENAPAAKNSPAAFVRGEPGGSSAATGRPYSPAILHQSFQAPRQTLRLSFAENTYYRQLFSMTAACAAAPMRTLPMSGQPAGAGVLALPTKQERMTAHIINALAPANLAHLEVEEPPAPRDMSLTVQTLRQEIAALERRTAGGSPVRGQQTEKGAPVSATLRALPHKAASAAVAQGAAARLHIRQSPQPMLRQIQNPANTVRFVPPAYVDPFGGKRPLGNLEWTDFGYRADGAAPPPVSHPHSAAQPAKSASPKAGLRPPSSMRSAAAQREEDALVPFTPATQQAAFPGTRPEAVAQAQEAALEFAITQPSLTMAQPLVPDSSGTAAENAALRGAVRPGDAHSAVEEPTYLSPRAAQSSMTMAQPLSPDSSDTATENAVLRGAVRPGDAYSPAEEPTYLSPQTAQPPMITQPSAPGASRPAAENAALRGTVRPGDAPAPAEEPTYLSPQTAQQQPPMTGSVLTAEDERAADAAHFFESYAQLYPEAAPEAPAAPSPRGTVLPGKTAAYTAPETAYLESTAQAFPRRSRVHSLNSDYTVQKNAPPGLDPKAIGKITDEVFDRIEKRIRSERRRYGL